jgi:hypothetical protein
VIVKKVARSKIAAPKSKATHVRALADYIAGPDAGGAGEKVEHRGSLTTAGATSCVRYGRQRRQTGPPRNVIGAPMRNARSTLRLACQETFSLNASDTRMSDFDSLRAATAEACAQCRNVPQRDLGASWARKPSYVREAAKRTWLIPHRRKMAPRRLSRPRAVLRMGSGRAGRDARREQSFDAKVFDQLFDPCTKIADRRVIFVA